MPSHPSHPHLSSSPSISNAPLSSLLPPGSWDSHIHILSPFSFPPSPSATYTPEPALLPSAQLNASRLSLPNLVLVQPSTYGSDNTCLIHHLRLLNASRKNSARGVVVIDPTHPSSSSSNDDGGAAVTDSMLQSWHEAGVRGVRVNLKSVGKRPPPSTLHEILAAHAERLNSAGLRGWVVQVFMDMADVGGLRGFVEEYIGDGTRGAEGGLKLVLDHLGGPERVCKRLGDMPGWTELKGLMEKRGVFVKISAPYRVRSAEGGEGVARVEELEGLVRGLMEVRGGEGVVFASDWPHTRHEGVDVEPWVRAVAEWAGDERGREKVFRENAERVWDVGCG